MLSKEEIEKAKKFLKGVAESQKDLENCKTTEFYKNENKAINTLLQYIEQLESENYEANNIISDYVDTWSKLKDKLQILKDELEKDGYTGYADDVNEILKIIGGENE